MVLKAKSGESMPGHAVLCRSMYAYTQHYTGQWLPFNTVLHYTVLCRPPRSSNWEGLSK